MGHVRAFVRRRFSGAFFVVAVGLVPALGCEEEGETAPYGLSGSGQGAEAGSAGSNGGGAGGGDAGEAGPSGDCGTNPADDVCTACLKQNCCTEWKTCRAEQACTVCTDCLAREQDLGTCNFNSGTCAFGVGDPTARALSCGLTLCELECGFS